MKKLIYVSLTYGVQMYRVKLDLVEEDLWKIPHYVLLKLQRWVTLVESSGIDTVRKIPGYNDKLLKGRRLGQRSIRLSKGYRCFYREEQAENNKIIIILEINKHEY